ncbi:hypothetical protein [Streptomyces sp. NPDC056549]|uniref:hypothetical protein n=1 Tax=Streptomyces sp. NPDC056549 TaxID=3345864 RepID=UPI00369B02DB
MFTLMIAPPSNVGPLLTIEEQAAPATPPFGAPWPGPTPPWRDYGDVAADPAREGNVYGIGSFDETAARLLTALPWAARRSA